MESLAAGTSKGNYFLIEGYHRLRYAQEHDMNMVPVQFFTPWIGPPEARTKMTRSQLTNMKQLRNYTESRRQNDGVQNILIIFSNI